MPEPTPSAPQFVRDYLKKQDAEFDLDPNIPSLAQFDKIMAGRKAQIAAYYAARDKKSEEDNSTSESSKISAFSVQDRKVAQEKKDDGKKPLPKVTPEEVQKLIYARYEARDKEMQTKEGRAKWDKFEKDFDCVGSFEAYKNEMIRRTMNEKLDLGALIKLAEEKKAESGPAATTTAGGKKAGGKGKKKA